MLKPFWVSWTYIANYSDKPVRVMASGYREAAELVCRHYSNDFKSKAKVYVTEEEPTIVALTSA